MSNRFEYFTILISKIYRSIKKIKNIEMTEYNLRSQHVSVLYYLFLNESLTSKELCEKCEEDKGTISRTVCYLEENDYLCCESNNKKRYNSKFILTNKGKAVGEEINDNINAALDELGKCLPEEERNDFYKYLYLISDKLEQMTSNYKNNNNVNTERE